VNSNTLTLFTVYVHKAVTAFSFAKKLMVHQDFGRILTICLAIWTCNQTELLWQ